MTAYPANLSSVLRRQRGVLLDALNDVPGVHSYAALNFPGLQPLGDHGNSLDAYHVSSPFMSDSGQRRPWP